MAALAANIAFTTSSEVPIYSAYMRASGADIFYKGALVVFSGTGQINCVSTADLEPAGVVMEYANITAANQLVRVAWHGLFKFNNTAFTIANTGALFYATAASDNPADLTVTATSNTAAFGNLIQVDDDATNGWFYINAGRKVASAT